jgi:hypothetical protein
VRNESQLIDLFSYTYQEAFWATNLAKFIIVIKTTTRLFGDIIVGNLITKPTEH